MLRSFTLLAFAGPLLISCAQGPVPPLKPAMDAVVEEQYSDNAPGASILVAQKGKVLYERAIGLQDVEGKEPLSTESVFRIGSITKQFTAVAILQLAEAGKLKLEDEVQKYVDFPKKDRPITIEHLLTHTSGIPNYTDLPSFTPEAYAKDISVRDMIATFADLPLEFEPGTRWNYSNSGYILLGAIVEKASGLSWEAYMTKHLFGPAGMTHTSAAAAGTVPGEAKGYSEADSTYAVSLPLSLTWPYSAGAIRSTVADLYAWNKSVFANKFVPKKWIDMAFTDHRLSDGNSTGYGYGWAFMNIQGSRTIQHNGGINGFLSSGVYLPDEDIYVVVLSNNEAGDADLLATKLAALALGKPYGGAVVPLDANAAEAYTGVYVNKEGVERYITADEKGLHSQRQGSGVRDMDFLGNDRFILHNDVVTYAFIRKDGRVTGARFSGRKGDEELTRTDKPLPAPRKEVKLDAATLKRYEGVFQLIGGPQLSFRADGDRLFTTAANQAEIEIFAEAPDKFFLKVVDARIEFYPEADGSVKRMSLFQGIEFKGERVQ
jgi:CubicO group peptidase (beta-lactamase class C family)